MGPRGTAVRNTLSAGMKDPGKQERCQGLPAAFDPKGFAFSVEKYRAICRG